MSRLQQIALGYFVILAAVASLNYIPGIADGNGAVFGIFALDVFDDALHAASALWALAAALVSKAAARFFLIVFGALYLADGALGLATGSGFLDFGIFTNGVLDLPFGFRILANLPHIALGAGALLAGLLVERR